MSRILRTVECDLVVRALRAFTPENAVDASDAQRLADEMAATWAELIIDTDDIAAEAVDTRCRPNKHCETCFCGDDPTADAAVVELVSTPEALVP